MSRQCFSHALVVPPVIKVAKEYHQIQKCFLQKCYFPKKKDFQSNNNRLDGFIFNSHSSNFITHKQTGACVHIHRKGWKVTQMRLQFHTQYASRATKSTLTHLQKYAQRKWPKPTAHSCIQMIPQYTLIHYCGTILQAAKQMWMCVCGRYTSDNPAENR